ncbi:MAG TPA: hypothetical protein VN428_11670 [Bryobacteraceae bacterium]|nr:hypothetical protein [Bryobacteraceae bacterium]
MTRWLRKFQPYLWMAVGVAIANLAWVLLGRFASSPRTYRQPEPQKYLALGTGKPGVRILQFYAASGQVIEGNNVSVCYGVENAASVRLEPAVEKLTPSFNRCFPVTPEATTTYKLTAEGADGTQVSAAFTVEVRPAPAHIVFVNVSALQVKRGQLVMVCAKTENAISGQLEPVNLKFTPGLSCVKFIPPRTMSYRAVFTGPGGNDSEKFRIAVR